jgi:DNA-binding transcriptional MerR regulator
MKNFSISDIERFSGIKAHTLRIWERRYRILQPDRTAGNSRRYSWTETKKALQIALLTKNGFKISSLARLNPEEIDARVQGLTGLEEKQEAAIIQLLKAMYTLDVADFDFVLDCCFHAWPCDTVVKKIIYPFLHKTGILWQGHKLDEEHFVVTAIRRKLMVAIEGTQKTDSSNKSVMLFLSGQDQLDLVLLYTNYLLRQQGVNVFYIGNDVTVTNLKSYLQNTSPQFLFTYVPHRNKFPFSAVSGLLKTHSPQTNLIVTAYPHTEAISSDYENIYIKDYEAALQVMLSGN